MLFNMLATRDSGSRGDNTIPGMFFAHRRCSIENHNGAAMGNLNRAAILKSRAFSGLKYQTTPSNNQIQLVVAIDDSVMQEAGEPHSW